MCREGSRRSLCRRAVEGSIVVGNVPDVLEYLQVVARKTKALYFPICESGISAPDTSQEIVIAHEYFTQRLAPTLPYSHVLPFAPVSLFCEK
jgi:hypothetical protein